MTNRIGAFPSRSARRFSAAWCLKAAMACATVVAIPTFAQTPPPANAPAPSPNVPASSPATQPANASPGYSLTIYSSADPATFDPQEYAQNVAANPDYVMQEKLPGFAVVRDVRMMDLAAGENQIRFSDVAAQIDPTTVSFLSLTAPDTTRVLEQDYQYDLASSNKLLDKYLGKPIGLVLRDGDKLQTEHGTLQSMIGDDLLFAEDHGSVQILPRDRIAEFSLPPESIKGLIIKPTLVWKVQAAQAGQHAAQVTYQTDNLTWRADYNVLLNSDDSAADINAWVTIVNESGASYPDSHVKLIAGDVRRIQRPRPMMMRYASPQDAAPVEPPQFTEKSFFEYHMYTLGRTTSVADNSDKQIELFPTKSHVPVEKTFVYYGFAGDIPEMGDQPLDDRNLGTQSNKKVDIYLSIKNSEQNGLGIPFPAGRIRAFKKDDADGTSQFIGEDVIQHTPKDETILLKLGSAFDIVGERKQTDFQEQADGHVITESFQIDLRNHKSEPVRVIVKENLFRWSNWEITKSSDPYEKQDFRTIHIPVDVPANGSKTVTYTVRYTWN